MNRIRWALVAGATLLLTLVIACWLTLPARVRQPVLRGQFAEAWRTAREWTRQSATLVFSENALESYRLGAVEVHRRDDVDFPETAIGALNEWEGRLDTRLRMPADLPVSAFYELLRRALRKPGDTVTLEALPTLDSSDTKVKSVTVRRGENCQTSFSGFGPETYDHLIFSRADCCPPGKPSASYWGSTHVWGLPVTRDAAGEFIMGFDSEPTLAEWAKNPVAGDFTQAGFAVFAVSESMPAEVFVDFLRAVNDIPQILHCGILRGRDDDGTRWKRKRGKELAGPEVKREPKPAVR